MIAEIALGLRFLKLRPIHRKIAIVLTLPLILSAITGITYRGSFLVWDVVQYGWGYSLHRLVGMARESGFTRSNLAGWFRLGFSLHVCRADSLGVTSAHAAVPAKKSVSGIGYWERFSSSP